MNRVYDDVAAGRSYGRARPSPCISSTSFSWRRDSKFLIKLLQEPSHTFFQLVHTILRLASLLAWALLIRIEWLRTMMSLCFRGPVCLSMQCIRITHRLRLPLTHLILRARAVREARVSAGRRGVFVMLLLLRMVSGIAWRHWGWDAGCARWSSKTRTHWGLPWCARVNHHARALEVGGR